MGLIIWKITSSILQRAKIDLVQRGVEHRNSHHLRDLERGSMVFFDDIQYAFINILVVEVNIGFLSLLPILIAVSLASIQSGLLSFSGLLCARTINIRSPLHGLFYLFDPLLVTSLAMRTA